MAKKSQQALATVRSLVSIVITLGVVIALLLLPEIVGRFYGGAVSERHAISSGNEIFSRIFSVFKGGVDFAKDSVGSLSGMGTPINTNLATTSLPTKTMVLSWDAISSFEVYDQLSTAQKETYRIASSLDLTNYHAKRALANFANGLQFMSSGPRTVMTAREALYYLKSLSFGVTAALMQDEVPASALQDWLKLKNTLDTTIFNNPEIAELERYATSLFRIKLTDAVVKFGAKQARLEVAGEISGVTISAVELFRNGEQVRGGLRLKRNKDGSVMFAFRSKDPTGIYKIKVTSTDTVYTKVYTFVKGSLDQYKGKKGEYKLLKNNADEGLVQF